MSSGEAFEITGPIINMQQDILLVFRKARDEFGDRLSVEITLEDTLRPSPDRILLAHICFWSMVQCIDYLGENISDSLRTLDHNHLDMNESQQLLVLALSAARIAGIGYSSSVGLEDISYIIEAQEHQDIAMKMVADQLAANSLTEIFPTLPDTRVKITFRPDNPSV